MTLGVDRGATEVEIKAAYRRLALRWHPDRNPGDAAAEDKFKELSIAYAVLSDEEKRGHYDRFGAVDGVGPLGSADIASATEFFDALFGDLFGLARRRKTAGRDMRYTLEVDFEEAALGCEKTITFERPEDCRACLGTGAEGASAGLVTCSRCGGEGIVRKKAGFLTTRRECMGCGGTGQLPRVRCAACEGAGLIDRERSYAVRVPPGSIGGSTQRLPREGAPGRRGGPSGDLHVLVRVRPHPFYGRESSRDGEVLTVELPLTFVEATLGAEVDVPVLDARVQMRVPPGTQSGATFRMRGKGFPRAGGRGDAHVRIAIETPTALSDEARALLTRLGGALEGAELPRRRAFRATLDRAAAGGAAATEAPPEASAADASGER
ncbi:MAG TPA: DnaJ C-terminal domain-containing protein [Polyangia bacterium]|nr:DnaJ C-terminal domain-containing protein [Polyangia bacterium]